MWTRTASVSTDDSTRPTVFLLSLDKQVFWDKMYSGFVDKLTRKATVKESVKAHFALDYLAKNNPSAIIVTDAAILNAKPSSLVADAAERNNVLDIVSEKVVEYVRKGGTAVLATTFSAFIRPEDLDRWFQKDWDLTWKVGSSYTYTTVYVNPNCRVHQATLPAKYRQKAVFLTNVPRDAAVYFPGVESRVNDEQAPVVFAKIGKGWLGYVGDVNNEVASQAVVLAMCGL